MFSYQLNQPFIIQLKENPTTGYQWVITVSPGLKMLKTSYSHHCPKGITGCGGVRTWFLQGTKLGEQLFQARYQRAWEKDPVKEKQILIRIE